MANIKVKNLDDFEAENLIIDVNNLEIVSIFGGTSYDFSALLKFAIKSMEFALTAYAIDSISKLVTNFQSRD